MGERAFLLGVIFVVLILAALTWFLGVSPRLAAAAEVNSAAQAQRDQNDLLDLTLAQRKHDSERIPEYLAAIYEARDSLPPVAGIPELRRTVGALALASGVEIESEGIGTPTQILGGVSIEPQMAAVGLVSEIEGMAFTTLFSTTVQWTVSGDYEAVLSFLDQVQTGDHRYIFVANLTMSPIGAETGGAGEVKADILGVIFTLDAGVPGISVPPSERPWPRSDSVEDVPNTANPFDPGG